MTVIRCNILTTGANFIITVTKIPKADWLLYKWIWKTSTSLRVMHTPTKTVLCRCFSKSFIASINPGKSQTMRGSMRNNKSSLQRQIMCKAGHCIVIYNASDQAPAPLQIGQTVYCLSVLSWISINTGFLDFITSGISWSVTGECRVTANLF